MTDPTRDSLIPDEPKETNGPETCPEMDDVTKQAAEPTVTDDLQPSGQGLETDATFVDTDLTISLSNETASSVQKDHNDQTEQAIQEAKKNQQDEESRLFHQSSTVTALDIPTTLSSNGITSSVLEEEAKNTTNSDATIISQSPPIGFDSSFSYNPLANPPEEITLPREIRTDEALPSGTMLGHFQITHYIGGGGMGRVYEALDLALDRKVAIKVLPNQRAQDQASVARFLNEAKSAARLNHEHIAQVYFCGQENGIPFIAFEYVEGINIRDYVVANGVLPLPMAINFILQITDALTHAATCGVTHRDVKPSNILITPEGSAKLIDMGLARLLKPSDPEDELTASGVTLGTFDYISPEQARDPREADVRSDIYSLGCTFFFMLTGQPPFPEGTVLQKLLKHQGDSPPDVRDYSPDLPLEVSTLIRKMMAKNPKDRFQTPKAISDTLSGIAEMIGLTPPAPGESTWKIPEVPKPNRLLVHLPWIIAVGLLFSGFFFYRLFFNTPDENLLPPLPNWSPRQAIQIPDSPPLAPTAVKPLVTLPRENPALPPEKQPEKMAKFPLRMLNPTDFDQGNTPAVASTTDANRPGSPIPIQSGILARKDRLAGGFDALPIASSQYISELGVAGRLAPDFERTALFFGQSIRSPHFDWKLGTKLLASSPDLPSSPSTPTGESAGSVSLVIDRIGKAPSSYATLQAALSAAFNLARSVRNGELSEIQFELRFSGVLDVPPITISGRKISIVGAPGFKPVLSFQTAESTPGGNGQHMFLVNHSELKLKNVDIEFTIPTEDIVATNWSVFEVQTGGILSLTQSTITVRNSISETNFTPRHNNVALFRRSFSSAETDKISATIPSEKGTSILVTNSILRGESALFQCTERGFGRLKISCSGINTTGPFLKCDDSDGGGKTEGTIEFTLDRSIGISRSSLILHERKEGNAALFPISVSLHNSIVKLTNIPLIASISSYPVDETTDASAWEDIETTTFLNVSGYRRHRQRQFPDKFVDSPLKSRNDKNLETFSNEAALQIDSIAPHLFTRDDFYRYIYQPLNSNINTPAEHKGLEEINRYFFEK